MWFHKPCQIEILYQTKLINEKNIRIAEKDILISQLQHKVAHLESEISQMQLVLMPISSPAGAAYARSKLSFAKQTATKLINSDPVAVSSPDWQSYLEDWRKTQEEEHEP